LGKAESDNNEIVYARSKISAMIHLDSRDMTSARQSIENALKAKENSSSVLYLRGKMRETQGNLKEAMNDFDLSLSHNRFYLKSIFAKVNVYSKWKQHQEAIEFLENCLEFSSAPTTKTHHKFNDDEKASLFIALSSLYETQQRLDSAIQSLDEAIKLRPNDNSLVSKREELEQSSIVVGDTPMEDAEKKFSYDFEELFDK